VSPSSRLLARSVCCSRHYAAGGLRMEAVIDGIFGSILCSAIGDWRASERHSLKIELPKYLFQQRYEFYGRNAVSSGITSDSFMELPKMI
jgi:hypothetical protein